MEEWEVKYLKVFLLGKSPAGNEKGFKPWALFDFLRVLSGKRKGFSGKRLTHSWDQCLFS